MLALVGAITDSPCSEIVLFIEYAGGFHTRVTLSAAEVQSCMSEEPRRPRVVIAEDYVLIQENIRRALPPECEVIAAVEHGADALDVVATQQPDILLLDVSLPDMSGFAVAERLFRANSPVKVIFLTAYADRSYVERAFEIGAKGYLLKGKMWTELPAAIEEVLAGAVYQPPPVGSLKRH